MVAEDMLQKFWLLLRTSEQGALQLRRLATMTRVVQKYGIRQDRKRWSITGMLRLSPQLLIVLNLMASDGCIVWRSARRVTLHDRRQDICARDNESGATAAVVGARSVLKSAYSARGSVVHVQVHERLPKGRNQQGGVKGSFRTITQRPTY